MAGLNYVVDAPGVARIVLHADLALYSVLLGSAGAIGGRLARVRLHDRLSTQAVLRLAQGMIVVALLVRVEPLAAADRPGQVAYGARMFLGLNSFTVTMQMSVQRWVVGRAFAVVSMSDMGGFAAGAWSWGSPAEFKHFASPKSSTRVTT